MALSRTKQGYDVQPVADKPKTSDSVFWALNEGGESIPYFSDRPLLDKQWSTAALTDSVENAIGSVIGIAGAGASVIWEVTLYNTAASLFSRYRVEACWLVGSSPQFTVHGLGPSNDEEFTLTTVVGPPADLLLNVTPAGANWSAVVTRTLLHML